MDQNVPIDRSKWKKPTYGGHYDSKAMFYEGISCRCSKCDVSFVFLAIEQQHKFEIEQKYPGWLPSLCGVCEDNWQKVSKKEEEYYKAWDKAKDGSGSDQQLLKDWLLVLIDAASYRHKGYDQKIRMIKKLLRVQ